MPTAASATARLGDQPSGPLALALEAVPRDGLALAGGKAVNLGELLRAGLPVPPGFCVTTEAYARAVAGADLGPLLEELAGVRPQDQARQATLAAALRRRILAVAIPGDVADAVRRALDGLGAAVPVAVRSSATAEDLPFASFAGQQDTYLNVVGADAVLEAVRRCWASLWTDRAVAYRASNAIDHRSARLAVVVQRLVDASVAGVLFTANPVTGRRGEAVVDASPGLGEAVVSGAVNPDRFVVDTASGAIRERRLGDKRVAVLRAPDGGTRRVTVDARADEACLSDEQLRALARLGERVERRFGAPQDTEFAVDAGGTLWLTQARPITTLFPLPAAAPRGDRDLRVYFNFNVAQGVFRPFTPMGLQAFRLVSSSIAALWGSPPRDPEAGAPVLTDAAGRIFLDVTPLVRSDLGRRVGAAALSRMETRSHSSLRALFDDPRLAPRPVPRAAVARAFGRFVGRTRLPLRVARAFVAPGAARADAWRLRDGIVADATPPSSLSAAERVAWAERLLLTWPARIFPGVAPLLLVGLGSLALAWRLLGDLVSGDEKDAVTRALPHNPTTEMDLALWALARRVRSDPATAASLRGRAPSELGEAYRAGRLPPPLQGGLSAFLAAYGHRGVAEIDLGLPRWSDEPDHLLGMLANYLSGGGHGGDVQFRAAAQQARAMARELARRAARRGWWRGVAVRFLLGRGRALAGTRELPKFLLVLLLARARAILAPVGPELVAAGRLDRPEDLWLLTLPEVRAGLAGQDQRRLARERRAWYADELRRRRQPRFLLSDGTEPPADAAGAPPDGALRGTAASAGRVTAPARVILDPVGASLEPGEILVAPSTDPGWTPLFLTAGGLVMEMGGAMSHGAVVAREYGIPAVVGVPSATERIETGQVLTVDGSAGTVGVESAQASG
ncbi:MAG TPA: PEP/pyruvate-binding domain-containing protein [Chloroflexota bacterium]|jgi:pyruvate,water dikinase